MQNWGVKKFKNESNEMMLINTIYSSQHYSLSDFSQANINEDIEANLKLDNGFLFQSHRVYNSKIKIIYYCFVVALSFKSTSSLWHIFAFTATSALLASIAPSRSWLNLMRFKFRIISGFSFKWDFSSLVGMGLRCEWIIGFLWAKLCIISSSSLKFGLLWSISMAAIFWFLDCYFFGLIVLFVFSFIIKFSRSWSIIIPSSWINFPLFYFMWGKLSIIGSFQ